MADGNSSHPTPNGAAPEAQEPNDSISADEIALYDRQIRLWGVQAQENIRKANVLLISIKALANEVAKNLVLAGINSLTIIDHEVVQENDLGAQFFISEADIGKNVRIFASIP
jgi:ubiquitin-like 1-activating enzyme E1 A